MTYEEFLKSKQRKVKFNSVDVARDNLNKSLFEYQKDLVYLALKKGHLYLKDNETEEKIKNSLAFAEDLFYKILDVKE